MEHLICNIHYTSQCASAWGRCLPRQGREQHALSFRHGSQPQKMIVSCLKRPLPYSPISFHKQIQLLLAACLVRVWLVLHSLRESFSWWKYLIIQGIFFSPTCSQWDKELASKWRRVVGEIASQGEYPLQKVFGFPVKKINYSGLSQHLLFCSWPVW